MEKMMDMLKSTAKKAAEILLDVVKKTAETTTKLLAKGSGKAIGFVGGKVNKFAADNKQTLLLIGMAVSAAAMLTSGVFYLLGRKK